MANQAFRNLFGRTKTSVIGMIHVKALPGSPNAKLAIEEITRLASHEAAMYKNAGLDGICIENMHDVPYCHTDHVGAETVAGMTRVCVKVREAVPSLPLGAQILAGANKQALAVALAASLDFVRCEGFAYAHIADEGPMNACAGPLLRYRRWIGAEHILIFTDVKKKHCSHAITEDVNVAEMSKGYEFFGSDGIILTGSSTGESADPTELKTVSNAVSIPVIIGSGVKEETVHLFTEAAALIIGSSFKHGGHWANELSESRLDSFMSKINSFR